MTDVEAALRTFLLARSGVYALTGTRIWTGRDTPPPDYTPADGSALCVKVRGGAAEYSDLLLYASVQCKGYGATPVDAQALARALWDALQGTRADGVVRWARQETMGVVLSEPQTDGGGPWWFVLTHYTVYVAASVT